MISEKEILFVQYADMAETIRDSSIAWNLKFDMIFSKNISKRLNELGDELGVKLDYYDPDTTYEEDVNAYVEAIIEARDNIINSHA